MELLSYALLTAAAALLLAALLPLRRLLMGLPAGRIRQTWQGLAGLLGLMASGQLLYGLGIYAGLWSADVVTAALLLLGNGFVFLVSQVFAAAIGSIQRLERLEQEAVTDPVTGLYNRRHLDAALPREMERCRREAGSLALMMIEIDHFKRFNERFGRPAGDRVLRRVGDVVTDVLRPQDIITRVGGVDIAVLLPAASLSEARLQAERVRIRIAATEFELGHDVGLSPERVRLTVSVGLTELSEQDGVRSAPVLRRVDNALREAQQAGRNRVEALCVPTEVAEPPSRVTHLHAWVAAKNPVQAA